MLLNSYWDYEVNDDGMLSMEEGKSVKYFGYTDNYDNASGDKTPLNLQGLENLENLEEVFINMSNNTTVENPEILNKCAIEGKLHQISINEAELSDLTFLENVTELEKLSLNNNRIINLQPLEGLNVTELHLVKNQIVLDRNELFDRKMGGGLSYR